MNNNISKNLSVLPQEAIDEFKKIYFDIHGIHLTDSDATEKAYSMLGLMKILLTPKKDIDLN